MNRRIIGYLLVATGLGIAVMTPELGMVGAGAMIVGLLLAFS